MKTDTSITTIKPTSGIIFPNLKELWTYRDLLLLFLYRDLKSRYAQSVLGFGWAFIQPIFRILVFSVVFGNIAKMDSEGIPYPIYSGVAIIPWGLFTGSFSASSSSLRSFASILTKVYFPRIILPISIILSQFLDFVISFSIIIFLGVWYGFYPNIQVVFLPILVTLILLAAFGCGLWFSSLGVKYRDISYSLGFFIQLGMFITPVIYGIKQIPEKYLFLYSVNPMVGIIEGFRCIFLSTGTIPWNLIGIGSITTLIITVTGLIKFKRTEKILADVI